MKRIALLLVALTFVGTTERAEDPPVLVPNDALFPRQVGHENPGGVEAPTC